MPRLMRAALLAGVVLLVAFVVSYATIHGRTGGHVPRGVHLGAVDLSGDTGAEARNRLAQASRSAFTLRAGDSVLTLPVADSGLTVQLDQTVQRVLTATWWDLLRSRLGHRREVTPVLAVDELRLTGALVGLAKAYDQTAREGTVTFAGVRPVAVVPRSGHRLDVPGTGKALRRAFPGSLDVQAEVVTTATRTTDASVTRALDAVASKAVGAPITVLIGPHKLVVQPVDLARSLSFTAQESGELTPVVGKERLTRALGPRLAAAQAGPRDATYDVSSGAAVLVPSLEGATFSVDDLVSSVAGQLTGPAPRETRVAATLTPPRVTTARAQKLGITQVISTFTTRHPCCAPRVENIHAVADLLDGYLVLPGQTFSLNAVVGKRDPARGFVRAPQIEDGQFTYAIGGGISQFATTMFNAVFFSGLKDVQHVPHSFYIPRYPPGRESTVSFPQPDFRFQNDTPTGVMIKASYTGTSITVTFWGTKTHEVQAVTGPRTRLVDFGTEYITRPDCIRGDGEQGFDIEVTRVFSRGGVVVRRQVFTTRYQPEPRFVCGPDPRGSASPSSTNGPAGGPAG